MYRLTWERLAKQETEQFNKRGYDNAYIECVECKGVIEIKLYSCNSSSYYVTDWMSAYNTVCGMIVAYSLGIRGRL